jgi:hypothetical protein
MKLSEYIKNAQRNQQVLKLVKLAEIMLADKKPDQIIDRDEPYKAKISLNPVEYGEKSSYVGVTIEVDTVKRVGHLCNIDLHSDDDFDEISNKTISYNSGLNPQGECKYYTFVVDSNYDVTVFSNINSTAYDLPDDLPNPYETSYFLR